MGNIPLIIEHKNKQPNLKMNKGIEEKFFFSQRRCTNGIKHMGRCSTSSVISKMQIELQSHTSSYPLGLQKTENKWQPGCLEVPQTFSGKVSSLSFAFVIELS